MRSQTKLLLAVVTVALLPVSACSSGGDAQAEAPPALPNTSSVLFPIHTLDAEPLEREKAAFWLTVEEFEPETRIAQKVSEIHTGPGLTYDVVDILIPGDEIVVDASIGHWLRIADHGGFVSSITADGTPWETWIAGSGEDEAVDACPGGLIEFTRITAEISRPYYAIHSACGGEPVLSLKIGDLLKIDGITYHVNDARRVGLAGDSDAIKDMDGEAMIHTCDLVHGQSAVVGIRRMMS
jgi:hypothetical protein